MSHGKVSVDILGDNSELNKALNQSLNLLVDFAAAATLGFARPALNTTVTAVNKLAEAYRTLQPLYQEQIESEIKLAAVLKATGESAGITSFQMEAYAEQMQNVIGVADHVILNTLAVAATFERIRGDNFQRAAEAAFDMSTVLGTNLTSSMIRVGRALEDPIRGMERLERISITFSQSQKDLIKTLVESNKLFEAQEIILGELEDRFEGTSESAGDTLGKQIDILGFQFRNIGERIFEVFVPALLAVVKVFRLFADLVKFLVEQLIRLGATISGVVVSGFEIAVAIFNRLATAMRDVFGIQVALGAGLKNLFNIAFPDVFGKLKDFLEEIFPSLNDNVDDMLAAFRGADDVNTGTGSSAGQRTPLEQLAKDISAAAFKEDTIQEDQLKELQKQTILLGSDTAVPGAAGFALG